MDCIVFPPSLPPFSLLSSCAHSFRDSGKLVLISLSLIGFFTFDMVYVTAVMNYAAQSEMLIYLLRSVRGLVEQKAYTEMDGAVKVRLCVCVHCKCMELQASIEEEI